MSQSRREFLGHMGLAALGATTLAWTRQGAEAAEAVRARVAPGIQLYTLRTLLARDFDGTLARVRGIGYREVELAGYHGRTPAQVRDALVRHRLKAPAAHAPLPASDDAWSRTLEEARLIGNQWLVIPWLDAALRRTPDDWSRFAARLNTLGAQTKRAGLRLAYHNHDFEFERIGNSFLFDVLLRETDPALVHFEMDVYWVTKANADPLAYLRDHPGRFPLLHLKDMTAAPQRRMVDVGGGSIDFRQILKRASDGGLRHAFVEHDEPADPLASARASYAYLARLKY